MSSGQFRPDIPTTPDSLAPLYESENPDRLPGRYIVRFKPHVSNSRTVSQTIAAEYGGRVYQVLEGLKGFWGELPDEAIVQLRRSPNVRYIEADVLLRPAVFDSIQNPAPQPLDRIDERLLPLDGRHEYASDGTDVHVWIIDSGAINDEEASLSTRKTIGYLSVDRGRDRGDRCPTRGL